MQLQASLETLNILGHGLGDVRGMAVKDQEQWTLAAAHEVLEQLQEPRGIKPLGVDLVPEGTAGVNGGDGAHALSPTAGGNLGRLSTQAPRGPPHFIPAHSPPINKEN